MITDLKPYPAYKDSGVEWLGQVPEHWEVVPLKRLAWFKSGAGFPVHHQGDASAEIPFFKVSDMNIPGNEKYLRVCANTVSMTVAQGLGATVFPAGTIVFPKVGGALLTNKRRIAANQCCIDNNMMACVARNGNRDFLFLVMSYIDLGQFAQPGPVPAISEGEVREIRVALPSAAEQTAIVRFLDWAEWRIRRVIRARKRRIKLLEEYKQALIHQAVTGRIDVRTGQPYPAYKDSGVEWLGQVPEHWEVRRLKRIARLNPSKSEVPLAMRNDPAVFLPMERVGSDGRFDASEVQPISALWNGFTYFRRGDVIVAKITPCFENGKGACLQNLPTSVGFGSTEFHVIRPSAAVTAPYLYRVTTLSEFRRLGADEMTGAAGQQRVPAEFIANFLIPLPPLPEQTAIAEYLDAQTAKIDAAIAADRRAIELLEEFRTRLIADVVTGKVDVREVAARLPEEPSEEDTPWTDEEERAQDETLNGEGDHAAISEEDG